MSCDILDGDTRHRTAMETGSEWLLNAIRHASGETQMAKRLPRQFIRTHGRRTMPEAFSKVEGSLSEQRHVHALRNLFAERARIDALRVSRDACPRCGIRGDLGCKHSERVA